MLSHHYPAKHAVHLIAFRFKLPHLVRYPHDTYCPIRYRTIMSHLVALRYMMLLLMPYLVNLRCMLSISWPSDTFMLNLITPTMHFALSCYTRCMLPNSLSHETFPNLVTPRYMLPISLPLDTCYNPSHYARYMLPKLVTSRYAKKSTCSANYSQTYHIFL